jgi:hypothetical protein
MKNTLTIKLLAIWIGIPICLIVFAYVATNLNQGVALQRAYDAQQRTAIQAAVNAEIMALPKAALDSFRQTARWSEATPGKATR